MWPPDMRRVRVESQRVAIMGPMIMTPAAADSDVLQALSMTVTSFLVVLTSPRWDVRHD